MDLIEKYLGKNNQIKKDQNIAKIGQIITNRKTGKAAIIYDVEKSGDFVIKYLKDGKPFGPLRDVQAKNFESKKN